MRSGWSKVLSRGCLSSPISLFPTLHTFPNDFATGVRNWPVAPETVANFSVECCIATFMVYRENDIDAHYYLEDGFLSEVNTP